MFSFSWLVALSLLVTACGIPVGPSASPNDAVPSGTITAQGEFTSLNGQAVSGTAAVYLLDASNYVVRLNGIQVPQEAGLQMVVVVDGKEQTRIALRSYSGSQNYSLSVTTSGALGSLPRFNQVNIHSPVRNLDYGQAILR